MEPKDTSKSHFYISLIKSVFRIAAGTAFIFGNVIIGGALLVIAEVLGIAEELWQNKYIYENYYTEVYTSKLKMWGLNIGYVINFEPKDE